MPLYEYRCFDCDTKFEKLTQREKADAVACPSCGSARARRLLSVFANFSTSSSGETTAVAATGGCGCGGHCACGGH